MAISENNVSDTAVQIKRMFEEISTKLVQTNNSITDLSKTLTSVRNSIVTTIASLNVNVDRLIKTFETVFKLSEIEDAKKSLLSLSNMIKEELNKKNVSDMVSELIRALLKLSKQTSME